MRSVLARAGQKLTEQAAPPSAAPDSQSAGGAVAGAPAQPQPAITACPRGLSLAVSGSLAAASRAETARGLESRTCSGLGLQRRSGPIGVPRGGHW